MREKILEIIKICLTLGLVIVALDLLGIGCPIRYVTGISCAGCGMTRAWISALQFHFTEAYAYHPLFWTVPIVIIFLLFRAKISIRLQRTVIVIFCMIFIIVYVLRLLNPQDTIVEINIKKGAIWRLLQLMRRGLEWLTTIVV